jgi:hypothetical protein
MLIIHPAPLNRNRFVLANQLSYFKRRLFLSAISLAIFLLSTSPNLVFAQICLGNLQLFSPLFMKDFTALL